MVQGIALTPLSKSVPRASVPNQTADSSGLYHGQSREAQETGRVKDIRMANHGTPVLCGILWTLLAFSPAHGEQMSYVENSSIKVGIDLDQGGTITFLARSNGGENLIN
jgi:hypothetical protein